MIKMLLVHFWTPDFILSPTTKNLSAARELSAIGITLPKRRPGQGTLSARARGTKPRPMPPELLWAGNVLAEHNYHLSIPSSTSFLP